MVELKIQNHNVRRKVNDWLKGWRALRTVYRYRGDPSPERWSDHVTVTSKILMHQRWYFAHVLKQTDLDEGPLLDHPKTKAYVTRYLHSLDGKCEVEALPNFQDLKSFMFRNNLITSSESMTLEKGWIKIEVCRKYEA